MADEWLIGEVENLVKCVLEAGKRLKEAEREFGMVVKRIEKILERTGKKSVSG